jgi:RHS repeat-associated protein
VDAGRSNGKLPRVARAQKENKVTVTYTNFGGRIVAENRDGVKRGYVHDPQGNVIALVDEDGAITDTWEYSAFGEVESHTGSSPTPFTWNGAHGYYSDPTGLTYVRARYYNPVVGQWQTADPLWPHEPAYTYGAGNPINRIDPSGMQIAQMKEVKPDFDAIKRRATSCIRPHHHGDCAGCAVSLYLSWWPHPTHRASPDYTHCMACCLLSAFGETCALDWQNLQNRFTPSDGKWHSARLARCKAGIGIGRVEAKPNESRHQKCDRGCRLRFPPAQGTNYSSLPPVPDCHAMTVAEYERLVK